MASVRVKDLATDADSTLASGDRFLMDSPTNGTKGIDFDALSPIFNPHNAVNPRRWGAVSNGTTDDAPYIQAALDSGAKVVVLHAGTYKCNSTLAIPVGVSLIGQGIGISTLDFDGATGLTGGICVKTATTGVTQIPELSSNASKGDLSLSMATAPSVSENDVLTIYNPTDYSFFSDSSLNTYYRAGEFCRVASVSGSTINLQHSLADDYVVADVDVYKLDAINSTILRDFTVIADDSTSTASTGLQLNQLVDSRVERVKVVNASGTCIQAVSCFGVEITDCITIDDHSSDFSTDYGVAILNSQFVNIRGGYHGAARHAVTWGGFDTAGLSVPSRYCSLRGSECVSSDTSIATVDMHGNVEYITIADCIIDGGLNFGGDYTVISGNTLRGPGNNSGRKLNGNEFRGFNHKIVSNFIESLDTSGNGCFIDVGGSNPVSAAMKHGGSLNIENNTMVYNGASITAGSTQGVKIEIDGYTGSDLNINLNDNVVNQGGSLDYWFNFVDIDRVTGTGKVDNLTITDNTIYGALCRIDRTLGATAVCANITIKNNQIHKSGAGINSAYVRYVDGSVIFKDNTFIDCAQYVFVDGEAALLVPDVVFASNEFLNSPWGATGTAANVPYRVRYADRFYAQANYSSNVYRRIVFTTAVSNWSVGDTITGQTSGATATIAFIASDEVFIRDSLSAAVSTGEDFSNGTDTYTMSGTDADSLRNAYYLSNITEAWHDNSVQAQGLAYANGGSITTNNTTI